MARTLWNGHISFGLVSIPVGLHPAVDSRERVHFRMLHRKDLSPIRYKKFCSKEDVEVPNEEIVKGHESSKGRYEVVEEEELEEVREQLDEGERAIDILQFVDFASLNPLLFETPYYLTPQKGGRKPYHLLREALRTARKVGVARFTMHERPKLAVLIPGPDALALEVIRTPSELRNPDSLRIASSSVREGERKMALALIEKMSGEWDPTEHPNVYLRAIGKLLAKKRPVAVAAPAGEKKGAGKVVDLTEALRRSLESSRRRGAQKRTGGGPRRTRKRRAA